MRLTLCLVFLGIYSAQLTAQTDCVNPDVNCDGFVTVNDILGVLSYFGDADVDGDGVWDSEDDCIPDECGVCNGPGPIYPVILDIEVTYDSVYAEQIGEWIVFEVGADTTFMYTCEPNPHECGTPMSYQGYDYTTILIGNQCWFAENLRNSNYLNGDSIPAGLSDSDWLSTSSGAVAIYGEGSSNCDNYNFDGDACDESWSLTEYGRLYNWYAVDDARGLCPSGWHVPTDGEWMTLEIALGMDATEASGTGWRGTDQGNQMKTDYGWYNGGNGTNSSGFSGLPGGYRVPTGHFEYAGVNGVWWSSSPIEPFAWYRMLRTDGSVFRFEGNRVVGYSVRCIKDAE